MAGQLGIRFKPDAKQALMGKQQGSREGLQRAIQLISLRYPRVIGAQSPVGDRSLLAGEGAPRPAGFNPNAAIMQAMIQALASGHTPPSVLPTRPGAAPRPRSQGAAVQRQGRRRDPSRPSTGLTNIPSPSFTPGIDTRPMPLPTGSVSREWDPQPQQVGTLQSNAGAGELETAAARSSRGYNPIRNGYDFENGGMGFL